MENNNLETLINSMTNSLFCNEWHNLSKDELSHLINIIDYSKIDDRYFCDYPELYKFIKWNKLDKMQAVRIVCRYPDLLKYINLKQYKYKIKEIFYFIKSDYKRIFKYFNFDFKVLSQDDAFFLFCLGKDEFLELIDIKKYSFGFIEILDIIKSYDYRRDIITSLNYSSLKNYQIADILMHSGYDNVDLFDLDVLSTLNWIELLSYKPEFLKDCNLEKFLHGDPFNLIQLITLFERPDLTYLLNQIDLNKITPFGWEKLLIYKTELALKICDFSKLKENNWFEISLYKPELLKYKLD